MAKIDKRAFYDETGKLYFEIHATDHNFPKKHPFGIRGEHSHNVAWEGTEMQWTAGQELPETVRKDNSDIL